MKKLLSILALGLALTSCRIDPAGTTYDVTPPSGNLMVNKVKVSDGEWIYVARFKDQPQTVSATRVWEESDYDPNLGTVTTHTERQAVIFEDSTVVITKKYKK